MSGSEESERSLQALRVEVLTTAMNLTAVAAPLLSVVVMVELLRSHGIDAIAIVLCTYTLAFPALRLLSHRFRYRTTALVYLSLMLVMAFAIQLRGGVASASVALELIVLVLSGLFFGARGATIGLGATLVLLAVAGFAVVSGRVPPIETAMWDPALAPVWLRTWLVLAMFGGTAAIAVVSMIVRLQREASLLRDALRRENEQREALERAEQEKERARTALAEAQRIEALGRLAGGVAHDYNNVLTVILAASEMARRNPGVPADVQSCLDDIVQAARQAADLTRSLLVLGRKDVSQPRLVDMAERFEQLSKGIRRLLPSDIDVLFEEGSTGLVHIDPTQLDRALLNLVINSRDAIKSGGKIELGSHVERVDAGEHGLPRGCYVAIWVKDDGEGMDEAVRSRVFEPFYTTKAAGHGSGMGMALVRGFVLEAGGAIDVQSAPDAGTKVTLFLPEASEALRHESARQVVRPSTGLSVQGRSILVVEDNPHVLASTVRTLRSEGFQVHQAADGNRALELVEDDRLPIDLLCIDGVIPGAGSAQVIERTRARRPSARIVVCSGYVEEELLRRGIRTGELACVRKPFTSRQLVDCIRDQLAFG